MLSTLLVLVYAFRAMESHRILLPGLEEYLEVCPQESRRSATGVYVKLFAATVTTVGVRGHLNSLNGSQGWKYELFRAIETFINPLASVFSFSTVLWYGFADLLRISPGPWAKGITLRYRLARFCGCFAIAASGEVLKYPLGYVNPQHVKTVSLTRDLKWGGRMSILFILLGQYTQAAVLLIRRIVSNTAAGVDYAMIFLVFAGLVALLQSLAISILNVSWMLDDQVQPCAESICSLPECIGLKKEQERPCFASPLTISGVNITLVSRVVLYELAGGYLHLCITMPLHDSIWRIFATSWSMCFIWQSSIYCFSLANGFVTLISRDTELQPTQSTNGSQSSDHQQQPQVLPGHTAHPPSTPINLSGVALGTLLFFAGVAAFAWLCFVVVYQLIILFLPSISLYYRIATEVSSWKSLDATAPCPQLWKDVLEDELWWF